MKVLEQLTQLAESHYVSPIASALVNIGLSNYNAALSGWRKPTRPEMHC